MYPDVSPRTGVRVPHPTGKRWYLPPPLPPKLQHQQPSLKRLSFPYIVEVYQYDETRNEYTMEFCDETLRKYIGTRNSNLAFATRKQIALQFL
jgi:eukaryotic-like serine/threonine-protein kinase